jgi:hypothetical protein
MNALFALGLKLKFVKTPKNPKCAMSTSMSTVSRDSYILSGSHSWLAETKALREAIGKAKVLFVPASRDGPHS